MAEISYRILKPLTVISSTGNGWTKEVNIVSWNNGAAKLDIREWDHSKEKMKKGITLFRDEAEKLKNVLNSLDFDDLTERMSREEYMQQNQEDYIVF